MAHVVALVVVNVFALAAPAVAEDCPELVGSWPLGDAHAVAVSGTTVYLGSGSALLVVDVSDPAMPDVVGEANLLGLVNGIALSGAYAYVAADSFGLRVVDVSNPAAPVEVGFYDTPGVAMVSPSPQYAYAADGDSGLRAVDA
jgi:hypothetical protein